MPIQNGRHFPDDMFKCIFLNENVWLSIKISLKFVPEGPINNIPALVWIMAWRRPGDKPLSEPMLFTLPTHLCVTRPQWVNFLSKLAPRHRHWKGFVRYFRWCLVACSVPFLHLKKWCIWFTGRSGSNSNINWKCSLKISICLGLYVDNDWN